MDKPLQPNLQKMLKVFKIFSSQCFSIRLHEHYLNRVEKTKYMLVSRDQNAGQTREVNIGNRSFENVSQFKYLGMTITNQNLIQDEIKRRLNSGNACYHLVQNLFLAYNFACGSIWV
jgi:hypothetical protein